MTISMGKLFSDFLSRGKGKFPQIPDSVLLTGAPVKMIQVLRIITQHCI